MVRVYPRHGGEEAGLRFPAEGLPEGVQSAEGSRIAPNHEFWQLVGDAFAGSQQALLYQRRALYEPVTPTAWEEVRLSLDRAF